VQGVGCLIYRCIDEEMSFNYGYEMATNPHWVIIKAYTNYVRTMLAQPQVALLLGSGRPEAIPQATVGRIAKVQPNFEYLRCIAELAHNLNGYPSRRDAGVRKMIP